MRYQETANNHQHVQLVIGRNCDQHIFLLRNQVAFVIYSVKIPAGPPDSLFYYFGKTLPKGVMLFLILPPKLSFSSHTCE